MESFLAFARPVDLKLEPVDPEKFLKMILDRWQPRMARVNVKHTLIVEAGVLRMNADIRSLERVITNLISNAIEAMSEVGDTLAVKVSTNLKVPGYPQVEISISDNGPGIPEDIRARIFEPFVTTRSQGTGLGLAISKQIVTAHKGSISVNSFPGGTVFSVCIPAVTGENS
jgi:signal transduction histidine kinase